MTLAIKTTVGDLIAMTQMHLYGTSKDQLNLLNGAVNASVTSIPLVDSITGAAQSSIIAIDDELMYVRAVDTSNTALTVIRGFRGSTAASHSDQALVEIAPLYPRPILRALLREEIASWPTSLFRVIPVTLSLTSSARGYNLTGTTSSFYFVVGIDLSPDTTDSSVHSWGEPPTYKILRNVPTTEFASGSAIVFDRSWNARSAVVNVAAPFDLSTFDDSTTLATLGLGESMADIAAYGVAWRLLATREIRRTSNESMAQPADFESVPAMFRSQAASAMKKLRDDLISEEEARLRAVYPVRVV